MGAESDQIVKHIEREREELGRNIDALESMMRTEPEKLKAQAVRWYEDALPKIVIGAFGLFLLIGFLASDRRVKIRRPRY